MNEFRADLHCHSTYSDGTLTPIEIIQLASQQGLRGLSITDHDTIEAYQTGLEAAKQYQIALISGAEFSAVHQGTSIHVLAYSFPTSSLIIKDFCDKHVRRRAQRNLDILTLLNAHGIVISEKDIQSHHPDTPSHTIGRPHIALAMLNKGYVRSIQEAFNRYIGENKPCYSPGGYFTVEETIDLIHQAKGLAVIAHPHLINNAAILKDLLAMNFDGIEGYYARFPVSQHARWIKIGEQRGWFITGGSDFHGDIKPTIPLGSAWVGEDTFNILYDHFIRNQI